MNVNSINQCALDCLSDQNWLTAQNLFFKNAKENPSHETYNNLGYFLICEGFTYKNGKTKNAYSLGLKYLLRAAKIELSATNLCAIAKAYDYALRSAKGIDREQLLEKMYDVLSTAYRINPSNEIQYNLLRTLVLTNSYNEDTVEKVKALIKEFVCEESIRLYFGILGLCSLYTEGLVCINQYREFLAEDDLLLFYAKQQRFREGYDLCHSVFNQYYPDKYISAAIIECCVNSDHIEEALFFAHNITENESSILYSRKENWTKLVFLNLESSTEYRRNLISEYSSIPPFIDVCCYFRGQGDGSRDKGTVLLSPDTDGSSS